MVNVGFTLLVSKDLNLKFAVSKVTVGVYIIKLFCFMPTSSHKIEIQRGKPRSSSINIQALMFYRSMFKMAVLIKVLTLITAIFDVGFVSATSSEKETPTSDSNPMFGGIEEVFQKTIEDEEWFGHRALPFSMDYDLLLIPEPLPVYGGKGKGKKGGKTYKYAEGGYGYGKGKGKYYKKSKKGFDPLFYYGQVHYVHEEGSPKYSDDENMYHGH